MLQERHEKNNLQMQPYHHYLAEYQNMDPKDIGQHLEIPFDENTGLFQVKFMERNYTVSHPGLEIHCLEKEDKRAVDLRQYFGQKKLKDYADFFSSSSSLCCGVI